MTTEATPDLIKMLSSSLRSLGYYKIHFESDNKLLQIEADGDLRRILLTVIIRDKIRESFFLNEKNRLNIKKHAAASHREAWLAYIQLQPDGSFSDIEWKSI